MRFAVHVTPKAGRDAVEGWTIDAKGGRALKVKLRAVPADGEANDALIALLAKTLGLAKSRIAILRGGQSRMKMVDADGDSALLTARLQMFGELR